MYFRALITVFVLHFATSVISFSNTAFAADLMSQSTKSGGVTITVKPADVSAGAASWSFQVSLSTHSQNLSDDLVHTAYIVNRAGKNNEPPTAWEGDAPGGHHRKGVLRFKALAPPPTAIELRIQRLGEKAPRVYRWDLNCPCTDETMHKS